MKMSLGKLFLAAVLATVAVHQVAAADECAAPIPTKKKHHKVAVRHAAPLTEEEKLARDYRARRAAGDNRNCPCAGNPGEYCSCDSYRGPGYGYGYYGYGYWGGDRYETSAGWSRGWGHSSDIPTSGYTGVYHR